MGFWKEDPHLHQALLPFETPRVVVVPCFTSRGYFTDGVVPRELAAGVDHLSGAAPAYRITPPVGTHPRMAELVLERARNALGGGVTKAALVLVGHGTERHPDSGAVTEALARTLGPHWEGGPVLPAFLDQEPRVERQLEAWKDGPVVVVPFFMSEGWHAGHTLPRSLGGGEGAGPPIHYARAVGTHPALPEIIEELALAALSDDGKRPFLPPGPAPATDPEVRLPALRARDAFRRLLPDEGEAPVTLLQLRILPLGGGRYRVLHRDDAHRDPSDLRALSQVHDAAEVGGRSTIGGHRPIRGRGDLEGGWCFSALTADEVYEVVAHLYPSAWVERTLFEEGVLEARSFRAAVGRHVGMFRPLEALPAPAIAAARREVCTLGGCLRTVEWDADPPRPAPVPEGPAPPLPCLEPCSRLLSHALELLPKDGAS